MTLGFCVDTGTTRSGVCFFESETGLVLNTTFKIENTKVLELIGKGIFDVLVMEDITPQGIMGKTTIETIKWLGRFDYAATQLGKPYVYISRPHVKKILTGKVFKIKDSHIRQRVIELIYPQFTRKDQGPLQGVTADGWSAVALGLVWQKQLQLDEDNSKLQRKSWDAAYEAAKYSSW